MTHYLRHGLTALLLLLAHTRPGAAQPPATVTEYYHVDALGSVRVVTDEGGAVKRRHDFLPFGVESTALPAGEGCVDPKDPRGFTGYQRDKETCQDYAGGRYYRSNLGRFTSVDPVLDADAAIVDPQRWNRYAYAANNPLRYVDPDGREPISAALAIGYGLYEFGSTLYDVYNAYASFSDPNASPAERGAAVAGAVAGVGLPGGGYGTVGRRVAQQLTTVYRSLGRAGEVIYVGITNDLVRRQAEHLRSSRSINIAPFLEGLSRSDAKAVEQALIESYGLRKIGGTLLNKINSIGKSNPEYAEQLRRGYELLRKAQEGG